MDDFYKMGSAAALGSLGFEKEAIFETLRHGWKALRQATRGGTRLSTPTSGVLQAERDAAVAAGEGLMGQMKDQGINIHRARVKTPQSITAKGVEGVPDDLLGMQMYADNPQAVESTMEKLRQMGVTNIGPEAKVRPGYHGVNIKAQYQGTPLELQIHPNRTSTVGSLMEHALAYKPKTEAPYSTVVDRAVGKHVAPRLVQRGSWVPQVADKYPG
jgi:hypothetical protein